ncbi:hypothetical protein F5B22DRAFT_591473, partial [Xylaria bambusicola]|uniref:uncharacterized protein n=1 Tax=Xylaria bambusicola TaxID=326684 RepID=UPI00200813BC
MNSIVLCDLRWEASCPIDASLGLFCHVVIIPFLCCPFFYEHDFNLLSLIYFTFCQAKPFLLFFLLTISFFEQLVARSSVPFF